MHDPRYRCEILADSVNPDGCRLTTFEVCFPRMVLADITRHRMLSFSVESTRAVPVEKRIEEVRRDPFIPEMRERVKGMARGKPMRGMVAANARSAWVSAAMAAANSAESMLNVEKGIAGRLLEPFLFVSAIISATEWDNFFALRCHPAAQYELEVIATMMGDAREASQPERLSPGAWHLPLVLPQEKETLILGRILDAAKVSAGRCASTSYLKQHDPSNDSLTALRRWEERLRPSAHWSPAEHPARCMFSEEFYGNFRGWKQLRKHYVGEAVAESPA